MSASFPSNKQNTSSPLSDAFPSSSDEKCRDSKLSREMSLNTEYKGPVIPPSTKERRKRRTLVLCFDGTGDQFDNDNSNVVRLFSLLRKGDSKQQLVYYQAGIGTYTIPQIATPFYARLKRTIDMMIGSSLNHHVMGGYEFLMENYKTGDRICIFGFSRGAYTARALAGMIEKVGLLPAGNHQQVPFAYKMYMKDDPKGWEMSADFKRTFSMDVEIEFVGVWDTVDSVGIIPRHVPFTKNNSCVKTFRHAMSLDEHRVKFKPNLYEKVVIQDSNACDFTYTPFGTHARNFSDKVYHMFHRKKESDDESLEHEDKFNRGTKLQDQYTDPTKRTDVLEVWFAGCHTDVGGGSVPNKTHHSLARIPLRWMIRQCFLTNSGIQFEADCLHLVGLDPKTLYPVVQERPPPLPATSVTLSHHHPGNGAKKSKSKKAHKNEVPVVCESCPTDAANGPIRRAATEASDEGTIITDNAFKNDREYGPAAQEEHEELHDALQPVFDQLKVSKAWWILEFIPLVHRVQKSDGDVVKVLSINGGRARRLARQNEKGIMVHRSVKMRIEAEALTKKYSPRLKFHVEPTWMD